MGKMTLWTLLWQEGGEKKQRDMQYKGQFSLENREENFPECFVL
jgi:hypothetical protein